jgi:hypothetical protein
MQRYADGFNSGVKGLIWGFEDFFHDTFLHTNIFMKLVQFILSKHSISFLKLSVLIGNSCNKHFHF